MDYDLRMTRYGKIRADDQAAISQAETLFFSKGFQVGFHGTSLWNSRYKDIDMLVIDPAGKLGADTFRDVLGTLEKEYRAKVHWVAGNDDTGLDFEVNIKDTLLHISWVIVTHEA